MPLTSGKTKASETVMDAIAILSRIKGGLAGMLALADEAIRRDVADDPFLMEAAQQLARALEFDASADVHSCVIRADQSIHTALRLDLGDLTLAQLRAQIVPLMESLDSELERCRRLMRALTEGAR